MVDKSLRDAETEELESRIETIEALDDAALGRFSSLDWVVIVLASVLIPAVFIWWAAG